MIRFLGKLLNEAPDDPVRISYLSRAEAPAWYDAILIAVDPQGACFERHEGDAVIVECLPWGAIGAIRLSLSAQGGVAP